MRSRCEDADGVLADGLGTGGDMQGATVERPAVVFPWIDSAGVSDLGGVQGLGLDAGLGGDGGVKTFGISASSCGVLAGG